MSVLHRWLGAVLLLLALPGLFVPGGLDLSVCVCSVDSCGEADSGARADCCVASCCDGVREERGPALAVEVADCTCCLEFPAEPRESASLGLLGGDTTALALPLPACALEVTHVAEPPARRSAPMIALAHAPPRSLHLPLRI